MRIEIPAVILAGGLGTRIREETEFRPKPMVEIGGRPVLWHIMKYLSSFGINRFVICVGYKGDVIRDYFLNYRARNNDFTVKLGKQNELEFHSDHQESSWEVTIAETGPLTNTGGRILSVEKYLQGEVFFCTYGDGLSDVDIEKLIEFHNKKDTIAVVTGVRPISRFGIMDIDSESIITNFREKPETEGWVNGGYFVFKPDIYNFLTPNSVLEKEPFQELVKQKQIATYLHEGFWQPMDTYRESILLNDMWTSGNAPWLRVSR